MLSARHTVERSGVLLKVIHLHMLLPMVVCGVGLGFLWFWFGFGGILCGVSCVFLLLLEVFNFILGGQEVVGCLPFIYILMLYSQRQRK